MNLEFCNNLDKLGLTPNQYYALLIILSGQSKKPNINLPIEVRLLKRNGWLDNKNNLTEKAISSGLFTDAPVTQVSNSVNIEDFCDAYRKLFPVGLLPSGVYGRSPNNVIKDQFKKFFNLHPHYINELKKILDVTEQYIQRHAPDYHYMKSSKYFILKNGESKLLEELENYKEEKLITNKFEIDL